MALDSRTDSSQPHLRALVAALQRRDPEASARVLADYGAMLRGFLTDALDGPGDVDDVLQQTLTDVWRRGPDYLPERASLATWLLMIARSRAIDHQRRRVPEPFDPTSLDELVDPAADEELERLIERWRIAGLLAALPRVEARLLAMRFYEELNQREIAERTGIALGTVKMRMAAGLERLRAALEDER